MTQPARTALTPELVSAMAQAAGRPIPADHLHDATELLDTLYALETQLSLLDLKGIEPELRWDARWRSESEQPA